MSNTITAFFKGRTGVAESVYQYDYGMVLVFDGIELPVTFDCYFSNEGDEEATPAIGTDNRVAIPNKCLSVPGNLTVHIPLQEGLNDSEVEYVVTVKVINRARPVNDGTEEEQAAISKAIAALNHNNLPGLVPDIVTEWLDEHPEATTTVQDGAITYTKLHKSLKSYVTPEMFGAVGDGVSDDTEPLQLAFQNERHLPILLTGKYRITSEIIIGGWNNYVVDGNNSEIVYEGDGSAIVIQNVFYGNFKFGTINAQDGNCIEFRAISWQSCSAYCRLSFNALESANYCIYVNCANKGYSNQMQVYGGRCFGGGTAVYVKNSTEDAKYNTNEWQFNYIGIEGVTTGFRFESLDYSIAGVNINYPRFKEDTETTTLIQIIGKTSYMQLYCDATVKPTHFDIESNDNQLFINAPMVIDGEVSSYRSMIRRGSLIVYKDIDKFNHSIYLNKIFNPIVISSPNSGTSALSATYNPMSIAEDMVAEGNYNRAMLVCTYGNTGFERYAPVQNGLYILLQRQNSVRIITMISSRIYLNVLTSGTWSGWKSVVLSA